MKLNFGFTKLNWDCYFYGLFISLPSCLPVQFRSIWHCHPSTCGAKWRDTGCRNTSTPQKEAQHWRQAARFCIMLLFPFVFKFNFKYKICNILNIKYLWIEFPFFSLKALLPALHITQQLPAEPDAAGGSAIPTVQGGVLEEGSISLESPLPSPLPLCRTPPGPTTLQQSGPEQL